MSERRGDWMQTYTGRRFWALDPRPEDVDIKDIAHALSMICRYQGHSRVFYSVAEHSVLIAHAMTTYGANHQLVLRALLHDAAEAYLCDVVRPVKRSISGYSEIERALDLAIWERFRLPSQDIGLLHELDNLILYDEAKALMRVDLEPWHEVYAPGLGVEIVGWPPALAKAAFLDVFHGLEPVS